ncbi:ribonuclease III [Archangium violaceum]|uniref:ribonuclease III n=1 Tax=Archangium violaceum TaxID=83451 RepID=UPI0019514EAA|nr:ribonuclease III [Archangium violaceum]QRN92825.1 ribonuclease III [Archangium violaceum]
MQPEECVRALEQRLGTTFSRPELARTALTHKTYVNERPNEGLQDNQRLEFLGDAVVNLVIAHRLMDRFPNADEGELSRLRARVVDEKGLTRVARRLELGELLLLGRGEDRHGGRDKSSILADAVEAIMAAVYLCSGLEKVRELVERHFSELLDEVTLSLVRDFKTQLQEIVQERLKVPPRYQVVSESGPEHQKTFEVEVSIGPDPYARASGHSKRDAEQSAAHIALQLFEQRWQEGLVTGQQPAPAAPAPQQAPVPGPKDDTPV